MNAMNMMKQLAKGINNKLIDMIEAGATMEMAQDLISTRMYQAVYNICEKDLGLNNYYNWGLDSTLGEYTRGEFNGYCIRINRLNQPAAHFINALYQDNTEDERQEYNMGLTMLSTMAHEMRHAYQQENNLYTDDEYIDSNTDYDAYLAQDCEKDARAYQNKFFTKAMYDALVEAVNK